MALTVKSRRVRSSVSEAVNVTCAGWRWSVYAPSRRNVVVSTFPAGQHTVTVPCFSPVGTAFSPKTAIVSSGKAEVVTSQSPGTRPSRLSRTQPPTQYA